MKPPYLIPTETIWHGATSRHMNKKQRALAPPNDLTSIAWMNTIAFFCARSFEKVMLPNILALSRTILQILLLLHVILNACWYYCSTVNRYATHILFLNISNRNIKRRFRSIDTVVENFARCQAKIISHLEALHRLGFHPNHAWLQPIIQVHVVNVRQASGRGDNDESLGTKQLS